MSPASVDLATQADGRAARRARGRPSLDLDEDAVLDATIAVLAERGDAASMQDIAARSGVAKTTLNDRFGGKPGLLERAITRERRRLADHLVASYATRRGATAIEQVQHGYQAFFGYAKDHPDAFQVLFGTASAAPDEAREEVVAAIAELVGSRFTDAGIELDRGSRIVAAVIAGAGEAVARQVVAEGLGVDVVARFVADMVVSGLANLDVGLLLEVNASARPPQSRGQR